MKRHILVSMLSVAATLAYSGISQAVAIVGGAYDGTDVGLVDTLQGTVDKSTLQGLCGNGGNGTVEACWVNSILGAGTATYFDKEETVTYYGTDTSNVFAFALTGNPGYYLIKNATFRALFLNQNSTDWAVFSLTGLPSGINLGGSGQLTISHVTTFNGTTQVPEPATLGLLGLGLLGVGLAHRRRMKAS